MKRTENVKNAGRRALLKNLLLSGSLGWLSITGLIRKAAAMGAFKYPTGIQKLEGEVLVNGKSATEGDPVRPGDTVFTGASGTVVFVMKKSVYLVRENTRLVIQYEGPGSVAKEGVEIIRIIKGKVLGVFARRRLKRIMTPTAVAGVRGSGVYVEASPGRTYICVCYGKADLMVKDDPSISESVSTSHHESPRFIYGPQTKQPITEAPVFNHTDRELILLESIVWRKPPFVKAEERDGGGDGGY